MKLFRLGCSKSMCLSLVGQALLVSLVACNGAFSTDTERSSAGLTDEEAREGTVEAGGTETRMLSTFPEEETPWIVGLRDRGVPGAALCTAILTDELTLVTNAACVVAGNVFQRPEDIEILWQDDVREALPEGALDDVAASSVSIYFYTRNTDIATIRLSRPVTFPHVAELPAQEDDDVLVAPAALQSVQAVLLRGRLGVARTTLQLAQQGDRACAGEHGAGRLRLCAVSAEGTVGSEYAFGAVLLAQAGERDPESVGSREVGEWVVSGLYGRALAASTMPPLPEQERLEYTNLAGYRGWIDWCASVPDSCPSRGIFPTRWVCPDGVSNCNPNVRDGCEIKSDSDDANCGGCRLACGDEEVCVQGACAVALVCEEPEADCNENAEDGCEVDLASDADHCGACGNACEGDARCFDGVCELPPLVCAEGREDCNGVRRDGCEINVTTDPAHCGACGSACAPGEGCSDGACTPLVCRPGFEDCAGDGVCERLNQADNCGACGRSCDLSIERPRCFGGTCRGNTTIAANYNTRNNRRTIGRVNLRRELEAGERVGFIGPVLLSLENAALSGGPREPVVALRVFDRENGLVRSCDYGPVTPADLRRSRLRCLGCDDGNNNCRRETAGDLLDLRYVNLRNVSPTGRVVQAQGVIHTRR